MRKGRDTNTCDTTDSKARILTVFAVIVSVPARSVGANQSSMYLNNL